MTLISGIGASLIGSSQWGFGQWNYPVEGPMPTVFQKTDGTPGQAPLIDPASRDYVVDDRGREVGTDDISAKVQLALFTLKDSSAVLNYGLDLSSLDVFRANSQSLIQAAVKTALSDMTKRNQILIQSITLQQSGVIAFINVNWINLINSSKETTQVQI